MSGGSHANRGVYNETFAVGNLSDVRSCSTSTHALTIYDWDDTILPTSWLRSLGYLSNNISDMIGTPPPILPAHVASMMKQIEDASVENLRAAGKLGRVVIVTNSSCLWVPFTARRFFPKLSAIVDAGFEVYSARPVQAENAGPNYVYLPSMAVTWKTDKFRELINSIPFPTCVSVGDGFAERCAVLAMSSPQLSGKAVRFPLQPSGSALLEQLHVMLGCLEEVVNDGRTGDLYLNPQTGGYRVIPTQPEQQGAIPLKMDAGPVIKSDRISIDTTTDKNASLMQSLASGIAYYGRTLSHRISLGSNKANTPKAIEASNADKKPRMAMISGSNTKKQSDENIHVEITTSSRVIASRATE